MYIRDQPIYRKSSNIPNDNKIFRSLYHSINWKLKAYELKFKYLFRTKSHVFSPSVQRLIWSLSKNMFQLFEIRIVREDDNGCLKWILNNFGKKDSNRFFFNYNVIRFIRARLMQSRASLLLYLSQHILLWI